MAKSSTPSRKQLYQLSKIPTMMMTMVSHMLAVLVISYWSVGVLAISLHATANPSATNQCCRGREFRASQPLLLFEERLMPLLSFGVLLPRIPRGC